MSCTTPNLGSSTAWFVLFSSRWHSNFERSLTRRISAEATTSLCRLDLEPVLAPLVTTRTHSPVRLLRSEWLPPGTSFIHRKCGRGCILSGLFSKSSLTSFSILVTPQTNTSSSIAPRPVSSVPVGYVRLVRTLMRLRAQHPTLARRDLGTHTRLFLESPLRSCHLC